MKLIDKVKIIDIDKIYPYINNPKEHPEEQINKIASSIKNFGFTVPIIIDEDFEIIAGHGRYKAAKKLELDKIPCIVREDLNAAQIKAFRIADNKVAMSEWDEELLSLELEDLDMQDYDLELTGFDNEEIEELFDSELEGEKDNFNLEDELDNDNIISKSGDIIKLGKHRLMCGDSTKEKDVNALMNGEKADMVFTDPPYGMFLDTDYSNLNWGDRKGKKYDNVIGDHEDFKPELITKIFDNFGYCKEIFLWGADYYYELIPDFKEGHYIVWDKTLESNGDAGSNSEFELVWTKTKHKRIVIHFNWFRFFGITKQDAKTRIHPTQKPLQVCTPFIEQYAKENEIVVDVFGGSGSTLIACEQLNRICYMMELDEKYVDVIIRRYIKYRLDNDKEVNIKVNGEEVVYQKYLNDVV
jgi:DNA modification methylase